MKIVIKPFDPDQKGYLRKQRRALELFDEFQDSASVQNLDELIEYISEYIEEPATKEEQVDALLDASRNEIGAIIRGVFGGDENPT